MSTEKGSGIKSTLRMIYCQPKANITKFSDYTVLQKNDSDKSIDIGYIGLIQKVFHQPNIDFDSPPFLVTHCQHLP